MASILTAPTATYTTGTNLRGITKVDVVARADSEVDTYCTADWANDVDADLEDVNKWFDGTSSAGIAGNTSTLLGSLTVNENFTLNSASPTLTVGDGSGSPNAFLVADAAGSSLLNFYKDDTTATAGDKRIGHNASENFVFQHYSGTWDNVMIIGANTWGLFGSTSAQSSAYTPTNVTTDRSYDANSTTLAELADVVGTMIADLQAFGLFG